MNATNKLYKDHVYGLTGGIASGKSTVSRFFSELGFSILDADKISKELSSEGGRAAPLILKEFGTLDRSQLRKLVFENPEARKKLESIMHPIIREESEKRILDLLKSNPDKPVIYEATLLVETGRAKDFKGLIVVTAPQEERIKRLLLRDAITRELAEKILKAQISDEERCLHATHRVENNGSEIELRKNVKKLADQISAR